MLEYTSGITVSGRVYGARARVSACVRVRGLTCGREEGHWSAWALARVSARRADTRYRTVNQYCESRRDS